MKRDNQLITPLMTDEEAQQIARRTVLAIEIFTIPLVIILFAFAWVALPA